jgi:hypothetical protein
MAGKRGKISKRKNRYCGINGTGQGFIWLKYKIVLSIKSYVFFT